jgi:hypothetical protein
MKEHKYFYLKKNNLLGHSLFFLWKELKKMAAKINHLSYPDGTKWE